MTIPLAAALMIPFLGTTLGAAGVFLTGKQASPEHRRGLSGFAAGIMTAASVWSLLIPAAERSAHLGHFALLPVLAGLWCGILFLHLIHLPEESRLLFAVTLHNLPEGMAVGAAAALYLAGGHGLAALFALCIGIALQNIPEGTIISLPLCAGGMGKGKSFLYGTLSGIVEPIGAMLTLLLAGFIVPALPFFLSFAAGAMLHVVVTELIPELEKRGAFSFILGFSVMMTLDILLG